MADSFSSGVDVSVFVSAVGRDPRDLNQLVYKINVVQPVQSWTAIRESNDFMNLGGALSSVSVGIPPCPMTYGQDLLTALRALQNWMRNILMYPGARDSPAMRHFLGFGANIVPPHFENISWVNAGKNELGATNSGRETSESFDEMEMEDMFEEGSYDGNDGNESDDGGAQDYSARYTPTEEAITQEDVMDIHCEMEMVDDVGSLAQSMGASHLGRSLQLQSELSKRKDATEPVQNYQQPQGLIIGGAGVAQSEHAGGIGNAMESNSGHPLPHGIGSSFNPTKTKSAPRLDSFKMIKVIGKGSFGKVFLVKEIKTGEMFALKVLKKDNIIKRNQVEHTRTERNVLGYVKHPFIVGLNMAFQSKHKLYFVLDYCAGGELFFHLGKLGKFPEPRAKIYAAEIVLAIDYVHQLGIIYRDLKPENVLLDASGHIRLTDFGLSKEGISGSSSGANSFCGTPEYLAPEILNRQGHGRAVDWWSLGALLYEMLTGLPPFYCRDREKLFEKIRKAVLTYPRFLSAKAVLLLQGLLTRDPNKRLGSGPTDAAEIKSHTFFDDTHWDKLARGEIPAPWDPQISGSLDTSQFDKEFTNMPMCSPKSLQVRILLQLFSGSFLF
mmetsp:Transcript_8664/g.19043  ORF Transcript_8664/g.19043 Transcript_8664/m.19043 type:complete len:611 (-) Transcript_8664:387-2219(-)